MRRPTDLTALPVFFKVELATEPTVRLGAAAAAAAAEAADDDDRVGEEDAALPVDFGDVRATVRGVDDAEWDCCCWVVRLAWGFGLGLATRFVLRAGVPPKPSVNTFVKSACCARARLRTFAWRQRVRTSSTSGKRISRCNASFSPHWSKRNTSSRHQNQANARPSVEQGRWNNNSIEGAHRTIGHSHSRQAPINALALCRATATPTLGFMR